MDLWSILILLALAVVIGWINNLAGAAGSIGLIALEILCGLELTEANVTLRLSALAIGVGGMAGFLSTGQRFPPRMWLLGLLTVPGALLGSYLALSLPEWIYRASLAAVLVLVLFQQLRPYPPIDSSDDSRANNTPAWALVVIFTLVGLHMGFIQVGFGLVCILALSTLHSRDLVQINSAKMALVVVSAATSTTTMAFSDKFKWEPALILGIGAGVGSFLAARWSVRKGHGAVRVLVLVICVAVLAWLGWRAIAE